MMDAFAKKSDRASVLGTIYKDLQNAIGYELTWKYYKPTQEEPELADWQIEQNEHTDYRVSVYEEVCKALEKML